MSAPIFNSRQQFKADLVKLISTYRKSNDSLSHTAMADMMVEYMEVMDGIIKRNNKPTITDKGPMTGVKWEPKRRRSI